MILNFILEYIVDDVGTHKRREYQRRQEEILVEQKKMEKEMEERKRLSALSGPPPKPKPLQEAKPEWFSTEAKNQLVLSDGEYNEYWFVNKFRTKILDRASRSIYR